MSHSDSFPSIRRRFVLALGLLAATLIFLLPNASRAQEPTATSARELTPEQVSQITTQLEALAHSLGEIAYQKNLTLTEIFLKASASESSALSFYLDSVQEVEFERLDRSYTEFREWKENNERQLEKEGFGAALQVQLRYLAISAQAARTADISSVFPLLTEFIDTVSGLREVPHRSLRGPVTQTLFAQRYDLGAALRKHEDNWEFNPLNIGGMYEKTVLPYLRAQDPTRVLPAWQRRIEEERRMASVYGEAAEEKFARLTLPSLLWGMLLDEYAFGDKATAAAKMLAHIDAHKTTHPGAGDWLVEAVELMAPGAGIVLPKPGQKPVEPVAEEGTVPGSPTPPASVPATPTTPIPSS